VWVASVCVSIDAGCLRHSPGSLQATLFGYGPAGFPLVSVASNFSFLVRQTHRITRERADTHGMSIASYNEIEKIVTKDRECGKSKLKVRQSPGVGQDKNRKESQGMVQKR
jgi:hypothetical protein